MRSIFQAPGKASKLLALCLFMAAPEVVSAASHSEAGIASPQITLAPPQIQSTLSSSLGSSSILQKGDHHHRGPRGHRGHHGKRGHKGRRGKTGTSSTVAYGYNFTAPSFNGDVAIIPAIGDNTIPYTVPLQGTAITNNTTFNSGNSSFTLTIAGDYAFDYYISVNSPDVGPSAIMALRLNGTTVLPGSYITVGPRYPTDGTPDATGYGHFVAAGLPAGTVVDLVVIGQNGLSLDTFASTAADPAPAQTLAYLGITKLN